MIQRAEYVPLITGAGDEPRTTGVRPHASPSGTSQRRRRRAFLALLAGAVLISMSAGSNYAFSAWAPQLQSALSLSGVQVNIVGLAGNAGVYISSPLWGPLLDRTGPSKTLYSCAGMVLIGYGGLALLAHMGRTAGPIIYALILLLHCLTGVANSGASGAAMNALARSSSPEKQGTALAIALAGYALSASAYSTMSNLLRLTTPQYLGLVAIGSATSFAVGGAGGVRIVPLVAQEQQALRPCAESVSSSFRGALEPDADVVQHDRSDMIQMQSRDRAPVAPSRAASVSQASSISLHRTSRSLHEVVTDPMQVHASRLSLRSSLHLTEGEGSESGPYPEERSCDCTDENEPVRPLLPSASSEALPSSLEARVGHEVRGLALVRSVDFALLFTIMIGVAGSGLLMINNVGTITETLWRSERLHRDLRTAAGDDADTEALRLWQGRQVIANSLGNAVGRLATGTLADLVVRLSGRKASKFLLLILPVSTFCLVTQAAMAFGGTGLGALRLPRIKTVQSLRVISALNGIAYGTLFGLCPSLTIDRWGLNNFSSNWGIMTLSPAFGGNAFNLYFGWVYDKHADPVVPEAPSRRSEMPRSTECAAGESCYQDAFKITTLAGAVSLLLSVLLCIRRYRRERR